MTDWKVGWLLNASPGPTFSYANPPYAWDDDNAGLKYAIRPTNWQKKRWFVRSYTTANIVGEIEDDLPIVKTNFWSSSIRRAYHGGRCVRRIGSTESPHCVFVFGASNLPLR